jgi:hypothetical protein
VNSTISRPREIPIVFMKTTLLGEFCVYCAGTLRTPAISARLLPAVLRSVSGLLQQPAQPTRLLCCEGFPQSSGVLPIWAHAVRQFLKPPADPVELIDFAQDRCKRHGQTASSLKSLRWENFRWTGLGQRT